MNGQGEVWLTYSAVLVALVLSAVGLGRRLWLFLRGCPSSPRETVLNALILSFGASLVAIALAVTLARGGTPSRAAIFFLPGPLLVTVSETVATYFALRRQRGEPGGMGDTSAR